MVILAAGRDWATVFPVSHAPAGPVRLVGSAWTRVDTAWRYRHWEIVAREGEEVILAAVLARACRHRVRWRDLRDRAVWQPGWQRIVDDEPPRDPLADTP